MEQSNKYIYSTQVLEWMTICTEFCKYLENCRNEEQAHFIDVMRGLLPMLYLKTSLLKKEIDTDGYNEDCVTEDDYNFIRNNVSAIMKEKDDFLDVFVEDFKYSDQAVLCTISENVADVYQAVRNAVEVFREGHEEAMEVAVTEAIESFEHYWGLRLLGALRALHDVRYADQYE